MASKLVRKSRPQINYDEQQALKEFVDPATQGYDPTGDEQAKQMTKQRLKGDILEDELNQNIESELYEFGHEGGYAMPPNARLMRGGYAAPAGGFAFAALAPFLPMLAPLVVEGVKGIVGLFKKKGSGVGDKQLEEVVMSDPEIRALAMKHNMYSGAGFWGDLWEKVKEGIKNVAGKLLTETAPNVISKLADTYVKKRFGVGMFGSYSNYRKFIKTKNGGLAGIDGLKIGHILTPVLRSRFLKVFGSKAHQIINALLDHPKNQPILEEKVENVISNNRGTLPEELMHRIELIGNNAKEKFDDKDYMNFTKQVHKKYPFVVKPPSEKQKRIRPMPEPAMEEEPMAQPPVAKGREKKKGWRVKIEQ
jgi:hypothetical protein